MSTPSDSDVPKDGLDKRAYSPCGGSYSWPEIIAEIESGSPFGQSYVQSLVEAAKHEGVNLETFLNSGKSASSPDPNT